MSKSLDPDMFSDLIRVQTVCKGNLKFEVNLLLIACSNECQALFIKVIKDIKENLLSQDAKLSIFIVCKQQRLRPTCTFAPDQYPVTYFLEITITIQVGSKISGYWLISVAKQLVVGLTSGLKIRACNPKCVS